MRRPYLAIAGDYLLLVLLVTALAVALQPGADVVFDAMLSWGKGASAEEAIGADLDGLRYEGFVLMHDPTRSCPGTSITSADRQPS